ncbi:MAG: hypothetical protein R3B06_08995 [Kofleriaceae bacterium]
MPPSLAAAVNLAADRIRAAERALHQRLVGANARLAASQTPTPPSTK